MSRPRAVESVLANLPIQCLGGYPENGRGATLVPVGAREDGLDVAPLELRERHVVAIVRRTVRRAGLAEREVARLDDTAVRKEDGPLHHVAQLADVARPPVFLKGMHRLVGEAGRIGGTEMREEALREQ